MIKILLWGSILSGTLFFSGCSNSGSESSSEYIAEIDNRHQLRIDSLKGVTGYLNLAGLFWLENEVNSFGSDSTNSIVFPDKAAADLGHIIMRNDSLWIIQDENNAVKLSGGNDADTTLVFVEGSVNVIMNSGDLHWFIIKRGVDYGIRLKDYAHPLLSTFSHIDNFPTDANWRLKATWEAYEAPKIVTVHNQVGMDLDMPVPGALNFEIAGEHYALEPIGSTEGESLFIMVYDKTSGDETYGSGRYIDVPMYNEAGITYIDFNKAYNPPCAFTDFATCLFPHKENRLPFRIEAGEKYSGSH